MLAKLSCSAVVLSNFQCEDSLTRGVQGDYGTFSTFPVLVKTVKFVDQHLISSDIVSPARRVLLEPTTEPSQLTADGMEIFHCINCEAQESLTFRNTSRLELIEPFSLDSLWNTLNA